MAPKRKKRKTIVILLEKYWLLVLWIFVNCYAFYQTYSQYKGKPEYYYLRMILGTGLCISRGSATVLNINCCLILLPTCRAVNSLVCKIINSVCNKNILLFWLQNTKKFHIAVGLTITISSVIHTLAHVQNAINFSKNYDEYHKSINWALSKNENPVIMVLKSLTGVTGVFMLVIIIVLTISSSSIIRRNNYNIFWYTHNVCYLFILLFLIHPLSRILKEQTNVQLHKPGCVTTKNKEKCEEAEFSPIQSQGWLWIILPLSLYSLDYLFRLIRRNKGMVCIANAKRLHDAVMLTVTLPHARFEAKPGQFVILNCPDLCRLEWHPFTIIKSPTSSQPFFQILVHARGDWSKKLYAQEFNCDTILYKWPPHKPIRLYVDGPYCSPMEELIKSRIVIGIAAGVGITPFMSSVRYLLSNKKKIPEKIHIIWIIRDIFQIEWSSSLFLAYHDQCWKNNTPDKFSFGIYLTNDKQKNLINNIQNQVLKNRLHPGRPDWNSLFPQWNNLHPTRKRYVFTCGPKSLNSQIKKYCKKFKNYHFVHESFA